MIQKILTKLDRFRKDAHQILGIHESSQSRIINLENTYRKLENLNIVQDDMFRQALTCTERGCFRAAHVMAWAAFMDFIELKMSEDGFIKLNSVRPKWRIKSIDDLREVGSEYQVIEAMKMMKLCSRTEMKAFHGLLNRRNECAHPSNYFPELNETIGFISELLKRLERL